MITLVLILSVSRTEVLHAMDTVQITGYMRDVAGNAVKGVGVDVYGLTPPWALHGSASTDATGRYALSLNRPKHLDVPIAYKGRPIYEGFELEVYSPTREWMPISCRLNTENSKVVEQDFTLQPAAVLKIKAYSPNGSQIEKFSQYEPSADRTWPVWTTGFDWKVVQSRFLAGQGIIMVNLGTTNVVNFPWNISGFGKVILRADDGGKGFVLARRGETMTINLNYELARTECRLLRESYERYLSEGYKFSKDLSTDIESAYGFLRKAESIADDVQRAYFADLCLNRTLWTAESLELERGLQDVEKNRKGDVALRIVDSKGTPIVGADIAISQVTHDFMFGVLVEGKADLRAYEKFIEAGINHVLLSFLWNQVEPSAGRYDFSRNPISEITSLRRKGIRLGGVGLIALEPGPSAWETGLLDLSFEQFKNKVYEHIYKVVNLYLGCVDYWCIVSNPYSEEQILGFVGEQRIDLIKTGAAAAKSADPRIQILVYVDNICGCLTANQLERNYKHSVDPYTCLFQLDTQGINHDGIALCLIYGSVDEFPETYAKYSSSETPQPFRDLASISRILDWYSTLSRPIYITEFNVPGSFRSNLGYWHRRSWDEELKVEWMKKFYTIAFSKPLVREITYRTARDQPYQTAQRGLLSASYAPRESFYALKRLITEDWTTRLNTKTDAEGRAEFRGFSGDYQITIKTGDSKINYTIHVYEGKSNVYMINLGRAKAEMAVTQAKEAVEKAKGEGRTIFLNRAESLLEDAGKALNREDYTQAMLLAEEANRAAGNAWPRLLLPGIIAVTATALFCVGYILRKRLLAKRRRHTSANRTVLQPVR